MTSGKTVDVLIGSPRDSFWESIQVILKGYYPYLLKHHHSVDSLMEQKDGEDFKPILALIDGQDGTESANEWVQSTKMLYPDCPILVLHSAVAPLDFDIVKKNGANEVMHLSFDREFISDMILQLAPIEMEGDKIPITALMPVDLRDVEAGVTINFDVYAHLPANHRSVLLRKSGDFIEAHHVEKFSSMKQQMYIKKTQMKPFFEYARTIMSMRDLPFPISMTEKFHKSKRTIYEFMAQLLNGAATDYQEGKSILEKCQNIVAAFELLKELPPQDLFDEICRFTGNVRTPYHDCICLSAYGAYFGQLLGWTKEKNEAAAIAGLLHNIGLAQLPISAVDKGLQELSAADLIEYKRYPDRSVNMVKGKKVPLSQEISEAIGQHRENNRGTGFPKALQGNDISDLGKLMSLAYRFHEMTSLQEGKQSATPRQALQILRNDALTGVGEMDMILITQLFKKIPA